MEERADSGIAATILKKVELGEARRTFSLAGPEAASIFVHIEADLQNSHYREGR